jgi:molecular chaperone DnaK
MPYILGIDLGTTNSVASVYRRGAVETILIEGASTFPSVVAFKSPDDRLSGRAAKKRMMLDPEHTVGSVKRFMGDRQKRFVLFGREYTPVDISAFLLRDIAAQAEKALGEKVRDAIITVPAYFNNNQKADTHQAGTQAGLNVMRLIPEPTAAAIAYGLDKGKDQTILVYDLGGGTFDVSILRIVGNEFTVKAVDGDALLGGDDFDSAIVDHLMGAFKKKTGIDLGNDGQKDAKVVRQQLKEAAEKAKIELSQAKTTEIIVPEIMGRTLEEELTLETYNELIRPFLEKTVKKIRAVLKEAGMSARDIDRVILVGGSTRNTAVKEIVTQEIKEPYISEHVDEEVSHGAAILGASLVLPEEDFRPIDVTNVTAHSLGLRVSRGKDSDKFKALIRRQTPVPARAEERFTTYRDNQRSVEIAVFQGEEPLCSRNTFVGGFLLTGIPAQPAGKPVVRVEFELNSSDILQVRALCDAVSGQVELHIDQTAVDEFAGGRAEGIVLLIDLSYSMDGWKLETTKKAVLEFLKIRRGGAGAQDYIGCVTFHSTAQVVAAPARDAGNLPGNVASLTASGTTNMAAGIRAAVKSLNGLPDPALRKRIILLSDGEPDSADLVAKTLKDVVAGNIRVDTVGAGSDFNAALLREIADKTGGQFAAADNIGALIQAFANLAEL